MPNQYRVQDSAFVVTLVINAVISVLVFIAFCVFRRKFKDFYEYRYQTKQPGVDTAPSDSFFGWVASTLNYSNEKIIQTAGLDGYFYLRQIRTSFYIMVVLVVLSAIILYPTNSQGGYNAARQENNGTLPDEVVGLSVISMSNIARGENLLWVHVVFTVIVTSVVCFFIYFDYKDFAERRITFKHQNRLMNHTVFIRDIPDRLFTKESLTRYMESYFPGQIRDIILINQLPIIYKLMNQREGFVKKYECAMEKASRTNKTVYVKTGLCGCFGEKREALDFYQEKIDDLDKSIEMHRTRSEQNMPDSGSGFIVFNHKSTAKIVEQVVMDKKFPMKMVRFSAPDPYDVYWPNVSYTSHSFFIRSLIVSIFIFGLVFFWSIPVAFLSGFSNLATLSKISAFSWLVDIIEKSSVLAGFLQGFLPNLVLIIFMALLIPIIKKVSQVQGFFSNSEVDESVFRKYFIFEVFNVFLVSAIAGSIFQSIESIVDHPSSIITMLATALPGQAYQMTNLIMIAAAGGVMALLRFIGLLIKLIKLRWLAKTPRQIADTKKCGSFSYSTSYAMSLLYLQICLAYSTMTPFILIFGMWYFGINYLVSKYNIIWVSTPEYQSGGSLYPSAFRRTIVGLIIYQLLMIGVFNVYKFFWGNLVVIPLIGTVCYSYQDYNGTQYRPPYYSPLMAINFNGQQGPSSP
ncbi:hypothetical protein PPL_01493 [Heterostelium album PN500]|uniref:Uncharacterized protein n=1 Tax=Heterostelium pallidum (strain ATCC 26659 / Pp 5 / PN500) TaxID=670386 RepID=D3AZF2_HETP5|nr:hypothetical protein PPL_01493 [Heterostelium album PN500]EFA85535.1 hypothetical protein PPL_01493 [Heterostelium album PN500]|eukprot:XP_020437643.1 hypothetical protein PPL_01493 [Heterostelium album PN500]